MPVCAQAIAGAKFSLLHNFGAAGDGQEPAGGVTFDAGGDLLGSTSSGGSEDSGVLYEIDPTDRYGLLHSFAYSEGVSPESTLTLLANGDVCGAAVSGGYGSGAVFQMNALNTVSVMHAFSSYSGDSSYSDTDGGAPLGGVTLGSDGNLYGTSSSGGTGGGGTIFQISSTTGFSTLHAFSIVDGASPDSALVLANGALYGVTRTGGSHGSGTIFKITQSGSFATLYSFSADNGSGNADGAEPCGKLWIDGSTIYGTSCSGGAADCGTVFKLNQQGVFTTLHSFGTSQANAAAIAADGATPAGGVVLGADGNLYGATEFGGAGGAGTLFRMTTTGAFSTIYSFDADNVGNQTGANPVGGLTFGPDGALYGATEFGGASDAGALYRLDISGLPTSVGSRFDYNRDGHPDLLWYNTTSGAVSQWLMDDTTVLQYGGALGALLPSTGWQPVASPDINGSGYPDLIWWNSSTGDLRAWTLQGSSVASYGATFAQTPDTNWKPVAAADDGGKAGAWTLVLQNSATGDITRWLMNGTSVTQYGGIIGSVGAGSPWQIVGAPDLDGDGKSDLLFWNSQTGEVSWWSCDLANSAVTGYHGDIADVADTSWHLIGSEDCNEDGHSDLVWWNAQSGAVSRWLMNGSAVTQYGGVSTQVSDTTWQPAALR